MCCMFFSTHGIEGERDAAIVTSSSKQFNTDADAWFPNSETRLAINGDIEGMSGEQHIRMRISVATSEDWGTAVTGAKLASGQPIRTAVAKAVELLSGPLVAPFRVVGCAQKPKLIARMRGRKSIIVTSFGRNSATATRISSNDARTGRMTVNTTGGLLGIELDATIWTSHARSFQAANSPPLPSSPSWLGAS